MGVGCVHTDGLDAAICPGATHSRLDKKTCHLYSCIDNGYCNVNLCCFHFTNSCWMLLWDMTWVAVPCWLRLLSSNIPRFPVMSVQALTGLSGAVERCRVIHNIDMPFFLCAIHQLFSCVLTWNVQHGCRRLTRETESRNVKPLLKSSLLNSGNAAVTFDFFIINLFTAVRSSAGVFIWRSMVRNVSHH